ncbi:MAG: class I SAM-dependent methyltransferase [Polyangiales bacterium]
MKEGRPSTTAAWVAAWRGINGLARPAIVSDPIAERLVPRAYGAILGAARRAPAATAAVHRFADAVSGGRSRHLAFRTRAIDEAISRAVDQGTRQLVLVGAGLDARAFRLSTLSSSTVFEVDHPATQTYKRAKVDRLAPLAREVRYVSTDFERDDLAELLAKVGFEAARPAIFLWEGVTMYLSFEAVERVLTSISRLGARGSTLLATYFEPRTSPFAAALKAALRGVSEPVRATFTPASIAKALDAHGFEVTADEGDPEWSPRYVGISQSWSLERLVIASRR